MDNIEIKKTVKLFTDSDLDGKSCAVLGRLFYGKQIEATFSNPVGINKLLREFIKNEEYKSFEKIYITDLNIKEDIAKMIDVVNNPEHQFIFIDHHETSLFMNDMCDWAIVEVERFGHKTCATQLFYLYLESKHGHLDIDDGQIRYYVALVRLWDTWDWKKADSEIGKTVKELNLLSHTYPTSKFVSTTYVKLKENRPLFSHAEIEIISLLTSNITKYCVKKLKTMTKVEFNNMILGVVFAEENISELGNTICIENPDIDIAFIICPDIHMVSLRTVRDDINLAQVAKKFGGGGHAKAAGFPYDQTSNRKLIDSILYDNH